MSLSFLGGRRLLDPLEPEPFANVEVIVATFGLCQEEPRVRVGGNVEVFVVLASAQPYLKQAEIGLIADPGQ